MSAQKKSTEKTTAPIVDADGIEILEPAMDELRDLGEIGGNAEVYVVSKTGKVVQGPGVTTEYHYQHIGMDLSESACDSYRMRWRQQGFERVGGVVCQGASVAHEVWRISQDRFRQMKARLREIDKETASNIGKVNGPAGGDWEQTENINIRD